MVTITYPESTKLFYGGECHLHDKEPDQMDGKSQVTVEKRHVAVESEEFRIKRGDLTLKFFKCERCGCLFMEDE